MNPVGSNNLSLKNHRFIPSGYNDIGIRKFRGCDKNSILIAFKDKLCSIYLYINLACLSVCLYPINIKTAEPIGPKFFVGHLGTPGNVYE